MIYPVGSIYMTATLDTAAKVETALGGVGTWVAWGAGRVPVGVNTSDTDFSTVEKTGGEKTHTLTTDEMPSHYHGERMGSTPYPDSGATGSNVSGYQPSGLAYITNKQVLTDTAGGGGAHNNLQPYITCYMYKRTA